MWTLLFILFVLRVESLLSRYKKHIVQTQHSLSKMIIAENGSSLYHNDEIEQRTSTGWLDTVMVNDTLIGKLYYRKL